MNIWRGLVVIRFTKVTAIPVSGYSIWMMERLSEHSQEQQTLVLLMTKPVSCKIRVLTLLPRRQAELDLF